LRIEFRARPRRMQCGGADQVDALLDALVGAAHGLGVVDLRLLTGRADPEALMIALAKHHGWPAVLPPPHSKTLPGVLRRCLSLIRHDWDPLLRAFHADLQARLLDLDARAPFEVATLLASHRGSVVGQIEALLAQAGVAPVRLRVAPML